MSSPSTAAAQAAHQTRDTDRHHQILETLINQAADLARMIHEDAQAHFAARKQARTEAAPASQHPEPTPSDPTAAFERMARTVRRCIAQAQALSKPAPAIPNPAQARTRARTALIRGVEDAICTNARIHPGTDAGTLRAELAERLDDPALDLDLQNRSVADVIEDICRDLGIARQGRSYIWQRRTPEEITNLRARAEAQPGDPRPPNPPNRHPAPQPGGNDDLPPDFGDLLALAAQLVRDG